MPSISPATKRTLIGTLVAALSLGAGFFADRSGLFYGALIGTAPAGSETDKYFYSETAGWIDLRPTLATADVTTAGVTGYGWSEGAGWIYFGSGTTTPSASQTAGDFGVIATASGADFALSGYAWSEGAGWLRFDHGMAGAEAMIVSGSPATFSGYAWSEDLGWVSLAGLTVGATDFSARADFGSTQTIVATAISSNLVEFNLGQVSTTAAADLLAAFSEASGLGIHAAWYQTDANQVIRVLTDTQTAGQSYSFTISGLLDAGGSPIADETLPVLGSSVISDLNHDGTRSPFSNGAVVFFFSLNGIDYSNPFKSGAQIFFFRLAS